MPKKANKRANGDGTIRQRKDGLWEARFTVGINPGTGKPIRKSIYGKEKDEVAAKLRQITATVDNGSYFDATNITVKQWFAEWLENYMSDKKPLTVKQYKSMSETHIYPEIGAVKLSQLSSAQLTKLYNKLAKEGKVTTHKDRKTGKVTITKEGSSPKTIKNIHAIIRKSLDDAMDQGLIKDNVATRAKCPRVEHKEIKPLTEAQQKAFFDAIKDHKYRWLYTVIIFTGLREAEAIGLTWDCVDFQKGTLKVYRQFQKRTKQEGGYQFAALKNDRTRVIQLSPYVVQILADLKKKQEDSKSDSIFVFTDSSSNHLSVDSVYNNFKRIAKSINAPNARVHDLRHTYAVNSLQEGDDFKTVQSNLGHATASFTLDIYGHVSDRMKEESARRQQAYIERIMNQ